jgi:hypothetical protein
MVTMVFVFRHCSGGIMAITSVTTIPADHKAEREVIEPMIPHENREDAERDSNPVKQKDEGKVVEPMIPHKSRREME